jgi:hypothetical protein
VTFPQTKLKYRDWNEELQSALEKPDSPEKYAAIASITRDFAFVAETFGKVNFQQRGKRRVDRERERKRERER